MKKKILFFAALAAFAIGSLGGHMAHAQTAPAGSQTLTPTQTAALEQQLDVAKAELANLEMQAGTVPGGDSGSATVATSVATVQPTATGGASATLSPTQITALKGTLSTLATMLTQLNGSIAADNSLTATQQTEVAQTLQGMTGILVAMGNTLTTGSAVGSAPVASAPAQSVPVAVNNAPSTNSGSAVAQGSGNTGIAQQNSGTSGAGSPSVAANTAPSTPAQTTPAATTNPAPAQTAQASGIWSFTKDHWPTIVIVLLIIAILAILFWPEKETGVKTVSTGNSGSGKPKAPIPSPSTANLTQNSSSTKPATPVAGAVAAPSQNNR